VRARRGTPNSSCTRPLALVTVRHPRGSNSRRHPMHGIRRALILSASLALLPALASADDPYAGYRIPEHNWRSWTAQLQTDGQRRVGTDFSFSLIPRTDALLRGSANTSLTGGYDSDPRSSAYLLSMLFTGSRDRIDRHGDANGQQVDELARGQFAF